MVEAYYAGSFNLMPDYVGAVTSVYGKALSTRYLDGTGAVSVQVSGLTPSVEHSVHVHTQPCSYGAGPHYKLDPTIEETLDTNEVWPLFTTDVEGDGWTEISGSALRGDAMSVIVHDPITNEKVACADLYAQVVVGEKANGSFSPFADADPVTDANIGGTASLTVSSATSALSVSWSGLDEAYGYTAHVHALPCAVNYGGGHYKFDPTIEETLDTNEVWPEVTVQAGGSANVTVDVPYALRSDAQAVVLHRDGPKVACADLIRESYVAQGGYGTPVTFPAADAKGVGAMQGSATIKRRLDGYTVVEVELQGLSPNATYPMHLHNRACGVADGGAHYLIDPNVADTDEANEIWITATADGSGTAMGVGYASVVARADGQSVVVHDNDDGERLACIDLL